MASGVLHVAPARPPTRAEWFQTFTHRHQASQVHFLCGGVANDVWDFWVANPNPWSAWRLCPSPWAVSSRRAGRRAARGRWGHRRTCSSARRCTWRCPARGSCRVVSQRARQPRRGSAQPPRRCSASEKPLRGGALAQILPLTHVSIKRQVKFLRPARHWYWPVCISRRVQLYRGRKQYE